MNYYDLCCQHRGEVVQITEKCGNLHVGKIVQVDPNYVWLERTSPDQGFGYGYGYDGQGQYGYGPSQGQGQGYGQYSYGGYGNYYQYGGYPSGYGGPPYGNPGYVARTNNFRVALAGIGGFALGSAFFW